MSTRISTVSDSFDDDDARDDGAGERDGADDGVGGVVGVGVGGVAGERARGARDGRARDVGVGARDGDVDADAFARTTTGGARGEEDDACGRRRGCGR